MNKFFLSIVLTCRNDNYGGDFIERLQSCLDWNINLLEKYKVKTEFILVNWNPVAENKPLEELIRLNYNRKHVQIRIITVSSEIHKQYINPKIRKTVAIFEFIAKNVGIRRAKGEFILATNADILLHPEIVKFIANGFLSKKKYYRANRFDFEKVVNIDLSNHSKSISLINKNVNKLFLKGNEYKLKSRGINFINLSLLILKSKWSIFYNLNLIKIDKIATRLSINVVYDNYSLKYHTHASGDFMLMYKNNWIKFSGYSEDTYISTHTDALFTVKAGISGLKEEVLNFPVYHQDHERRYNTDVKKEELDKNIQLMFNRFVLESREMERLRIPITSNTNEWGLVSYQLVECIL